MAGPTLEIEIKLSMANAGAALELLARTGFAAVHERAFESNIVFDTPTAELATSGRLLRLRSFLGEAILTFKGPAEPGPHKSRPEIETPVGDFFALRRIIEALGYGPRFRYEKYRTTFARPGEPGHVVLDETPIGVFLELEGEPDWIDSTAVELGFTENDYILDSYGTLFRDYCTRTGAEPSAMVFRAAE
jgi:adenylate cyclase class 2